MSCDVCSHCMHLFQRAVRMVVITAGLMFWSTMSASLLAAAPPEKLLDCTVREALQPDLTLSLKVANFSFVTGQDLSGVEEERVAWHDITQGILVRYVELCTRYNRGVVDRGDYRARLRDFDGYYRVAKAFEERLLEKTDTRMQESIGGTENSRTRSLESFGQRTRKSLIDPLRAFAKEIGELGPMGRPLQPRRPTDAPDILGSPAAK